MDNETSRGLLAEASDHWERTFPSCNRFWTSSARKPDFWGLGAEMCKQHGIPESMLIALVYSHLNDGPNDVHVKFHCNVMKAQGLVERAVLNARIYLKECLKEMEAVSLVSGIPCTPQNGILDMFRSLAELVLENYRLGMKTLEEKILSEHNKETLADNIWDPLAYVASDKNPFFLLDQAKRPMTRHLAFNNVKALLIYQPWVRDIWEGTVRGGGNLGDEIEMAGPRPDNYPFNGPNWAWPPALHKVYRVESRPVHPELTGLPRMYVNCPLFNQMVSSWIEFKADVVRREDPFSNT